MIKVILHLNEGSSGHLALAAAHRLIEDGYDECIYSYSNGEAVLARKNKKSVSAYEQEA